jgi:hypothetical protein
MIRVWENPPVRPLGSPVVTSGHGASARNRCAVVVITAAATAVPKRANQRAAVAPIIDAVFGSRAE